jgi:hypothetical protein
LYALHGENIFLNKWLKCIFFYVGGLCEKSAEYMPPGHSQLLIFQEIDHPGGLPNIMPGFLMPNNDGRHSGAATEAT